MTRAPEGGPPPRGYERSRQRADELRAQLEPLAPGERPLGLRLAVALAALIALANLVAFAAGAKAESPGVGIGFTLLLAAAAVGMWQRRYVVILLFEMALALSLISAVLSLAFASNLAGVALCLGILVLCGPVFWLLIRVMARLQVPRR
jgi:hypothetical protein